MSFINNSLFNDSLVPIFYFIYAKSRPIKLIDDG